MEAVNQLILPAVIIADIRKKLDLELQFGDDEGSSRVFWFGPVDEGVQEILAAFRRDILFRIHLLLTISAKNPNELMATRGIKVWKLITACHMRFENQPNYALVVDWKGPNHANRLFHLARDNALAELQAELELAETQF